MQERCILKDGVKYIEKNGVSHIINDDGRIVNHRPWLGDILSFAYDPIMEKCVFPGKFGGEATRHFEILRNELKDVHGRNVLELAAGSGSAVNFLPDDNRYAGIDISPGLLRRAAARFRRAGFENAAFYVARAEDLPFRDGVFDVVLCILSLNFFEDIPAVLAEIRRVAAAHAIVACSVPVPERNGRKSTIRGILHSERELETLFEDAGFHFDPIHANNGSLLYFKATKKDAPDETQ